MNGHNVDKKYDSRVNQSRPRALIFSESAKSAIGKKNGDRSTGLSLYVIEFISLTGKVGFGPGHRYCRRLSIGLRGLEAH